MLGEEYLDTRKKLESIVRQIKHLSSKIDVPADGLDDDEVETYLTQPFRILVCGEPGAGKTSFITSLFGGEVKGLVQQVKAIQLYGASVSPTEEVDETLDYKRISNLGEVEILDTKGVGKMSPEEMARVKELIPTCDYVLWVVSAENPWASNTWDFITEMSGSLGVRNALVLKKVDLRQAKDIPILMNHLRSLSQQRAGRELPIHCLSVENGKFDKDRVQSEFAEFRQALDRTMTKSRMRVEGLQFVYDRAKKVIDRLEDTFFFRKRALQGDKHVLQAVEAEVERARENEVSNARENLNRLGIVLSEQVDESVKEAAKKNGVVGTIVALLTRGDGAIAVEKRLQELVSDGATNTARRIAHNMLERCKEHWEIMRPELQRKMEVNVVDFDEEGFEKRVELFAEKMEQSTRHALVLLKLRRLLDKMMVERQRVLKRALLIVLVVLSAAGIAGYMSVDGHSALAFFLLGIVVLLIGWMFCYGKKTKDALLDDYADTLVAGRWHLADMLQDDYEDGVREFFLAYSPMFENIRRYIVKAEADLEPKQKEWHELFLMLTTIEQEL